ncbi:right-handed parallel beta-helix repeat-containing protein [Actinomadura rubrisoli]|uniref:Right-handed parallel beta-helix repeat-containing protein n=1 Tax=Actinomadura rubrisoli TaxID=2530368 RepID=A0A4R5BMY6_9ACTN|nr:right-handed parallel beta-helix repeat-containing protein [Actinomadura rubrisoli]TDD86716.1 right-handed parallel beta-helix repeat-containing protein [Actinomadura rubrisoli]
MRRVMCAALVAVPLSGVPLPATDAASEQLYVATWGSDAGTGSLERPFATLARAQREVRARAPRMRSDIVVNLRGGTHVLTAPLRPEPGRGGHRVIYQAHGYGTPGRERAVISGGRTITGWRREGRAWRAEAGDLETRQLYVADRRAVLASLGAGLPGKVRTTRTGYITDSDVPRSWRRPQDIEFVYTFPYWAEARCGVAGVAALGHRTQVTMDGPCWKLARGFYEDDGDPLGGPTAIENSVSFLRAPGSWYLDRSRPGHHVLYYVPRPGEDMRTVQVVAPVLQTLVDGTGRPGAPLHDVAFRGLTFAHATWTAPSEPAGFVSTWSLYKRPGRKGYLTVPGNIVLHGADRVAFQGNRFTHLGAQALEISKGSSGNVVEGNVFTDVSDGGIVMGVTPPDERGTNRGNRISDNWIHHVGVEYRAAAGIWNMATRDTTIAHNRVGDVPNSGILSGRDPDLPGVTTRTRIIGNRVYATNKVLNDGGGIYLRGAQGHGYADGAVLRGNAVTGAPGEFNIGIYTDDTTRYVRVTGNAVYRYVASIGGCSEAPERPVSDVRYSGNFWDDAVPSWLKRREYPGAWPPASDDCGDPRRLAFRRNTRLDPGDPEGACAARPACEAIVAGAGPRPAFRRLLQMP